MVGLVGTKYSMYIQRGIMRQEEPVVRLKVFDVITETADSYQC